MCSTLLFTASLVPVIVVIHYTVTSSLIFMIENNNVIDQWSQIRHLCNLGLPYQYQMTAEHWHGWTHTVAWRRKSEWIVKLFKYEFVYGLYNIDGNRGTVMILLVWKLDHVLWMDVTTSRFCSINPLSHQTYFGGLINQILTNKTT